MLVPGQIERVQWMFQLVPASFLRTPTRNIGWLHTRFVLLMELQGTNPRLRLHAGWGRYPHLTLPSSPSSHEAAVTCQDRVAQVAWVGPGQVSHIHICWIVGGGILRNEMVDSNLFETNNHNRDVLFEFHLKFLNTTSIWIPVRSLL